MDFTDWSAILILIGIYIFCMYLSYPPPEKKYSTCRTKAKRKAKDIKSSEEQTHNIIQKTGSFISHKKNVSIGILSCVLLFGLFYWVVSYKATPIPEVEQKDALADMYIDSLVPQVEKDPLLWRENLRGSFTVILAVGAALDQPGTVTTTKTEDECKNFPACQPNIDHIDVTEPSRSTAIQDALFDSYQLAESTSEMDALLQFNAYGEGNSKGLIRILDTEMMLTHHNNTVFEKYLNIDYFKVCNAGSLGGGNHAGVYLKLVDTDTICDENSGTRCKVGRMTEMCSGSKDRDGYDPEKVVVAFDLDKCGSKCVSRIEAHLTAFKAKIPSLDYKTVTTAEFVKYPDNNGGLSPFLGLFFQQNEAGGYDKLGVKRAVILNLAESTLQTHWKGDIGPNIEQNSAVHEGLHYQAAINFIKERRGNAIAMWGKVKVVLSEEGILFHPLAEMTVTFEISSCSWCPETGRHGVNLANVKIEVTKVLDSNTAPEEVVAKLEEKFIITDLSRVTGHLALNDIDGWVGAVEHRMNENQPPKKQVFATRVCYDRMFDVDGSYEKKLFTDPIVIKGHGLGESGYNTDLIECHEREGSRDNIEERLVSSKRTRGDPKKAEYSLVVVFIDPCKECFRSTSKCKCTDTIEAMMERHNFVHFATYNTVKHYYHRNKHCQTTLAFVHGVFSTALHSDKSYLPQPSHATVNGRMNNGDGFDYTQGIRRVLQHPSEPFLANQKASESLVVASAHKMYVERRWHIISVIGTMFAKDFLLINNDSINSLGPEFGLKAGPVSMQLRGDEKQDYNIGYKLANELARRNMARVTLGREFTLEDIEKFSKSAVEKVLVDKDGKNRQKVVVDSSITNIKHVKSTIIAHLRTAHGNFLKKAEKKRKRNNQAKAFERQQDMKRQREDN